MTSGILLVDKPQGWTSHDVVARVRRLANMRKVGHAGTLDPMATGLLVVGLGSATRLLTFITGADKEYFATIRLGQATSTDDAEGEILEHASSEALAHVTDEAIAAEARVLSGTISQVPSSVSAIKVDGKRAYALARAGEQVELKARTVTVSAFEIIRVVVTDSGVDVDVRVECSSGTYIRALARDMGLALGVGGHLTALRRTRVGGFTLDDAVALDAEGAVDARLTPASAAALTMPVIKLDEQQAVDIGHGKKVAVSDVPVGHPLAALAPSGRLVAVVERRGDVLRVVAGFPEDPS